MGLTPLDAEKFEFQNGFRGYDRSQVEQFRALVVQTLEEHIRGSSELKRRIEELEHSLAGFRENEELLRSSMMLAQKTGEDVVSSARREAEQIKAQAHVDCQEIRNELTRLRGERAEFEYSFHGLLSGFLRRLEHGNPELNPAPAPQIAETQQIQAAAAPLELPEADEFPFAFNEPEAEQPQTLYEPYSRMQEAAPPAPEPAMPMAAGGLDRDADIDDFSRVLDDARRDYPELKLQPPAAEEAPAEPWTPGLHEASERDEDMDIDVELEQIVSETDYPEDDAWRAEAEPAAQAPQMAGLEEVEGLAPPPSRPEPDPLPEQDESATDDWEAAGQPETETWVRKLDETPAAWEPSSPARVQPSRSFAADEAAAGSANGEDRGWQDVPLEDVDSGPRVTPSSNLDQIFSGIPSQFHPEDEDDKDAPTAQW